MENNEQEDLIEDIDIDELLKQAELHEAASLEEKAANPAQLKKDLAKFQGNLKFAKGEKEKEHIQSAIDDLQMKIDALDEDADEDEDSIDESNADNIKLKIQAHYKKATAATAAGDSEKAARHKKSADKLRAKLSELTKSEAKIDGKDDDDQEDDGEGTDDIGDEDSDVDNDGDSDKSDEFLTKRRKAIAKKESADEDDEEELDEDALTEGDELDEAEYFYVALSEDYVIIEDSDKLDQSKSSFKVNYDSGKKSRYFDDKASATKFVSEHGGKIFVVLSHADHDAIAKKGKEALLKADREHKKEHGKEREGKFTKNNKVQIDHEINGHKMTHTVQRDKIGRETDHAVVHTKHENYTADLDALTEGDETLSEDFKAKASVIFEAALTERCRIETERLEEEFNDKLTLEAQKIQESLEEKVDNYLTYAIESWVEDNKIAIDSGLRTEVAESFIDALKHVFVEHYIDVPETKKDLVADLETKLTEAKEALCETSSKAETLAEQVETLVREKILAEATETLADTQAARLMSLTEGVEFGNEESFRKKVSIIKEAYFKGKAKTVEIVEEDSSKSYSTTEVIVEETTDEDVSPQMAAYAQSLARINKANAFVK